MVFALVQIHIEGLGLFKLAGGLRKKRAKFFRNYDRYSFIFHGGLDRFDGFFQFKGFDHMDVLDTKSPDQVFYGYLCQLDPHRIGVHTGMGLVAGHGRSPIVQNHEGEFVIVVNRINESGDPEWKKVESPMNDTTF